jgi:type II secretory pathway pseudopilin PulG
MTQRSKNKVGFTTVELLTVILLIGILSGMGVAGLQTAVANARIKDAAYNVSAYLERTANEARKLNFPLCVKKENDQKLKTYAMTCTSGTLGEAVDSLVLDAPNRIMTTEIPTGLEGINIIAPTTDEAKEAASFIPQPGLSAAPRQGFVVIRYGDRDLYGAATKSAKKNSFVAKWNISNSWSDL